MAGKPETFVVQQVLKREEWPGDKGQMVTYELLFADDREVFKAHVPAEKDPGLEDGKEVEGWKNPGGKFGIATGSSNGAQRSSSGPSGAGRDDPTGKSIERQKAADIAMNGMVGLDFGFKREAFAADYKFMFQVVHAEITGEGAE